MRALSSATLVVVATFLTAGCGGSTGTGRVVVGSCASGVAKPVGAAAVRRAFASVGVQLGRDIDCLDPAAVASVSNTELQPPVSASRSMQRHGAVICQLYAKSKTAVMRRLDFNGGRKAAQRDVLNVSCVVYPHDVRHFRSRIASIERALRRL